MPFNGFTYAWGEAFKSLYRNRWMSIASVGVVVVTLLMLGTFMMVSLNLTHITDTVKGQVEIVVYVDENAAPDQQKQLQTMLEARTDPAEIRFPGKKRWSGCSPSWGFPGRL